MSGVTVHGSATAEELAAVLAVLAGAVGPAGGRTRPSSYDQWRLTRQRALRRSLGESHRPI
jgi:hypothetical protein